MRVNVSNSGSWALGHLFLPLGGIPGCVQGCIYHGGIPGCVQGVYLPICSQGVYRGVYLPYMLQYTTLGTPYYTTLLHAVRHRLVRARGEEALGSNL